MRLKLIPGLREYPESLLFFSELLQCKDNKNQKCKHFLENEAKPNPSPILHHKHINSEHRRLLKGN